MGPGTQRKPGQRCVAQAVFRTGRHARFAGCTGWRRQRGIGQSRENGGGRIRPALPGTRADGALELHGEDFTGQMRAVDRHAIPDTGTRHRRADHRPETGTGVRAHHVPRRWFWSPRQSAPGHRVRSGAHRQSSERTGENRVEPRRRRAGWFLPARIRAQGQDRAGCTRPTHCVAARAGRAIDHGRHVLRRLHGQGRH